MLRLYFNIFSFSSINSYHLEGLVWLIWHPCQMPLHQQQFEKSVQIFCFQSSNGEMLASPCCTQSLFWLCNLKQPKKNNFLNSLFDFEKDNFESTGKQHSSLFSLSATCSDLGCNSLSIFPWGTHWIKADKFNGHVYPLKSWPHSFIQCFVPLVSCWRAQGYVIPLCRTH